MAYALDVVSCPDGVQPALARLLDRVAVVDDLATARALVAGNSELTAVTKDGDLLGAHVAAGGSASQPSLIEIQAAVDEASAQLSEAVAATERLGFDLSRLERERHEAQKRVDVALAKLHESDATLAAVAEELGQYGAQSRAARGESERLERSIAEAQAARTKDMEGLEELEARLARAEEDPEAEQEVSDDREQLAEAARGSRQAEMESRLALRTAEERSRALHGRADQLLRAAQEERETRARELERRRRLVREGEAAQAVAVAVAYVLDRLDVSIGRAAAARAEVEQARKGREEALLAVRSQLRDLNRAHDELVNSVHRDELARQQQKMRIDQLQERALEELGMDADVLIAEYGPDQLVPFSGTVVPRVRTSPEPTPFVREEQQKRLRQAERELTMLGTVNPLALEEFSALEERHQFLGEQLEDLRKTRKDLLDIVREVDARVEQVFTEAYQDVVRRLRPDLRPAVPRRRGPAGAHRPRRHAQHRHRGRGPPARQEGQAALAALRRRASLVAVAFLVALFKARPSPFYILDEVEAALDDTNLGRLLEIYEELRENSQLLVITHQKRTMEVGDALYGVSMRGDGVSAVISQRLREAEASAAGQGVSALASSTPARGSTPSAAGSARCQSSRSSTSAVACTSTGSPSPRPVRHGPSVATSSSRLASGSIRSSRTWRG